MKRLLVVVLVLICTVGYLRAETLGPLVSPRTATYTFTNDTAMTFQAVVEAVGGKWNRTESGTTYKPQGIIVQVETNGVYIAFDNTPVAGTGSIFLDNNVPSANFQGQDAAGTGKICNKTAGQNAKFHLLWYY